MTLNVPIKFEDLLKVVDTLTSEQKRILYNHIEEDWARRFGAALEDIRSDVPAGIEATEVQTDVAAAIAESRHSNK